MSRLAPSSPPPDGPLPAPADVAAEFAPPPGDQTADFAPPPEAPEAAEADDQYLGDSVEAQGLYDRAVKEAESGNEGRAVVHFLRASKLAESAREWYLAALALHAVGDIFRTPAPPYDLERAFRLYRRAVAAYEQCGHFAEAQALAYRVACVRLWNARTLGLPWWERAELFAYWAAAGFGHRPARVLLTALATVLVFAAIYWAAGGVQTPDGRPVGDPGTALYFSGVTFLTIGYGDLVPAPHVRGLAVVEGAIGVTTVSFFVVVLANRLRR
ncbi:MAG: potassium channel family protein [Gemmataceae bacterium]|nr:potassium channel family protein [Gemmataceae bacterium]